jgi:hypothetical protein
MASFSLAKSVQPDYNYTTSYLPIFESAHLVSVLHARAYGGIKIDNVFNVRYPKTLSLAIQKTYKTPKKALTNQLTKNIKKLPRISF